MCTGAELAVIGSVAATVAGSKMKHDQREKSLSNQRALTRDEIARSDRLTTEAQDSQTATLNKFGTNSVRQIPRTTSSNRRGV